MSALTETKLAATARDAVETLRLWKRYHSCAGELKASLPDATLMFRSLDKVMEVLLNKNFQSNFRVNTLRLQYEVEVNSSDAVANKLYEILLAEA